ncbi:MAG TPA: MBL fold metallo-hydrolase [Candidatus Paceibacterota bacterium]|nr:MBL fold metallo-hydrolase [Candidatus Paceibacterota bacterium]
MVITHHGGQCFKVTFGDLTLVFDPISKKSKLEPIRFGADIALVSRNAPDYNGIEEATYGEKKPFVIDGPGEYEYRGVEVQGFLTKGFNTVYSVALEGMTLLHLGALTEQELSKEAREAIGEVDVLFLPVGGGTLGAKEASALASSLSPHVIVPMRYDAAALKDFLKEEGGAEEETEKLTLKKKDAASKDGAIIVLKP